MTLGFLFVTPSLIAGPLLSFDVNDNSAFEIPLSNVSQCATGKNEVTLEFHQNDDTEVSLMEVRFYVPPSQADERQDPVEVKKDGLLPFLPVAVILLKALFLIYVGNSTKVCFPTGVCPECVV